MEGGDKWRKAVDHAIEEAMARGEFDYSRLKGKRLSEVASVEESRSDAMANKLLRNSGHAPPFLMKRREIDAQLAKQRETLLRYALRRQRLLDSAANAAEPRITEALTAQADADWQWAVRRFDAAIPALNKEIDLFNLMNKIPAMWMRKVVLEKEIERAQAQVDELMSG
ncbi:MAG: DUF1992 domain-containing protein [Anaerolineales bacterium]|nr:DUF1992 domain-containing protein [Anaerolineales bacterium]MCB9126865.1 DUF1992 domain-containing protein [Ardenticatenales bacterium]MCB9172845.1 DUF1992 domain-containing protein [Ardenticatenales bacterium]